MMSTPTTGQWLDAPDGRRWWFDSGALAFDFAYTGGFEGPPEWEHWHGPADVERWWRERFEAAVPVDGTAYRDARELRDAIARAVMAVARDLPLPDEAAAVIDRYAAMPDLPPQLGARVEPTSDRLLAVIGRDAVTSLGRPDRVRICAADDCALMYLDTSRAGSRTWCSMRRCGNRHKIRRLRERRAAANPEEN
ncbi:CGNR zinc finger domain-containing protein [Nocardiopsis lambiniae]|uniref:CGNR zinc finger domain-containing protein n=1 Tax=Nocardiopsis lambiniae TaxID=3075539 RepID=A0ABU2ME17_9ACTN|nr:CGNR zinc finger domain-containing protein [Nocardiopsis sp. DSM 44743]MDT0330919.1 CGNR zinc finger domain-containing protein [Nocardiopsis sp. DSM 44743]